MDKITKQIVAISSIVIIIMSLALGYLLSNPKPAQKIVKEDLKEVQELTKEIKELKDQVKKLDESISKRDSLILKKEQNYADLKHKGEKDLLIVAASSPDVIDSIIADGISKRKKR